MTQTTADNPLNVQRIELHKGFLVHCNGFGSAQYTDQNRQALHAKGYEVIRGKQNNEVKYFFFDTNCRKCRRQINDIRKILRHGLT